MVTHCSLVVTIKLEATDLKIAFRLFFSRLLSRDHRNTSEKQQRPLTGSFES